MKRDVLVLCYHAVSERWRAAVSVTPEALGAQVGHLLTAGYRAATFTEAVEDAPFPKTLAVTFDDAFRSVLDRGLPVLAELGVPATLFVPTAFPGSGRPLSWPGVDEWLGGPHEHELAALGWDDIRALAGEGWEIGSHTSTHPRLTQLGDAALDAELRGSRDRCERELGTGCASLAYPYGDVDSRVIAAAAACGYRTAAALPGRLGSDDPLDWPRVGVWHDDEGLAFRLKVSRTARRLRSTWMGPLLERGYDGYGAVRSTLRRRSVPPAA